MKVGDDALIKEVFSQQHKTMKTTNKANWMKLCEIWVRGRSVTILQQKHKRIMKSSHFLKTEATRICVFLG